MTMKMIQMKIGTLRRRNRGWMRMRMRRRIRMRIIIRVRRRIRMRMMAKNLGRLARERW
jgi:hypothetical protein